ncbi:hypothetical protein NP493_94g05028 [Ridgeia piscesae]|uniref:Secreted protein n=1 Tax=Ridgeia piscesae TaxID=27915 RepID=A0AAD9P829_RIDPI|nr:hypothetical protein NP493_94g05028 [Ridgeia piscesae]
MGIYGSVSRVLITVSVCTACQCLHMDAGTARITWLHTAQVEPSSALARVKSIHRGQHNLHNDTYANEKSLTSYNLIKKAHRTNYTVRH